MVFCMDYCLQIAWIHVYCCAPWAYDIGDIHHALFQGMLATKHGPLHDVSQNGLSEVEQFLSRQGLNAQQLVSGTREVTSKAEGAINYAAPTVKSTASTLSTSSPQALLQYGGIATGVYFLVSALCPFVTSFASVSSF